MSSEFDTEKVPSYIDENEEKDAAELHERLLDEGEHMTGSIVLQSALSSPDGKSQINSQNERETDQLEQQLIEKRPIHSRKSRTGI